MVPFFALHEVCSMFLILMTLTFQNKGSYSINMRQENIEKDKWREGFTMGMVWSLLTKPTNAESKYHDTRGLRAGSSLPGDVTCRKLFRIEIWYIDFLTGITYFSEFPSHLPPSNLLAAGIIIFIIYTKISGSACWWQERLVI